MIETCTIHWGHLSTWEQRFLSLASFVSTWSKDPSTQVGAVVAQGKRVISMGFNGFPPGVADENHLLLDREAKLKRMIHAESNALHYAGDKAAGSQLYCTLFPCAACTTEIIRAKVKLVIAPAYAADSRWLDDHRVAEQMMIQSGVTFLKVKGSPHVGLPKPPQPHGDCCAA